MPDPLWEDESPTAFLIRTAHEKANVDHWDRVRFTRLTILWNITPYELSALAGVCDQRQAMNMYERQEWPRPVRLHFCRLEILAHQLKLGSVHIDPELIVLAKLAASRTRSDNDNERKQTLCTTETAEKQRTGTR